MRLRRVTGVDFDPHWYRHTYATRLLRRNTPIEVVSTLLGHSSIATTMDIYGHLSVEDARRALEAAGWSGGQVSGPGSGRCGGDRSRTRLSPYRRRRGCWASSWPPSAPSSGSTSSFPSAARWCSTPRRAGCRAASASRAPEGFARATTTSGQHDGRPDIDEFASTASPEGLGRKELTVCVVPGCRYGGSPPGTVRPPPRVLGTCRQAGPRGMAGRARARWTIPVIRSARCRTARCGRRDARRSASTTGPGGRPSGRPDIDEFVVLCESYGDDRFDFRPLGDRRQLKLELQYALQCRHDERQVKTPAAVARPVIALAAPARWPRCWTGRWNDGPEFFDASHAARHGQNGQLAFLRYACRCLEDLHCGSGWEAEFPRDVWELAAARDRGTQAAAVRRHPAALAAPAGETVRPLAAEHRPQPDPDLHRHPGGDPAGPVPANPRRSASPAWPASTGRSWSATWPTWPPTRARSAPAAGTSARWALSSTRSAGTSGITACPSARRSTPTTSPSRRNACPAVWPSTSWPRSSSPRISTGGATPSSRLLTVILMRCGLRVGDATKVAFDCVVRDGDGAPYLRYTNRKMKREALVPIDEEVEQAITAQQQRILRRWPGRQPVAVPRPEDEPRRPQAAEHALLPRAAAGLAGPLRCPRRARSPGAPDPAPVAPYLRHQADQPRRAPGSSTSPARSFQRRDDGPLRPAARHHRPPPLGEGPQGQRQGRGRHHRPRRPAGRSELGQATARPRHPGAAQRLLRPARAEDLPARQRLPDMPDVRHYARVPAPAPRAPPAGRCRSSPPPRHAARPAWPR